MSFVTAPLASLGLLSIIYTLFILANLSRRYGQVIRLPSYYRGFYVSMTLIGLTLISHLIRSSVIVAPDQAPPLLDNDWFYLFTYHVPLALAVALAMGTAWRYWSWLLMEQQQ